MLASKRTVMADARTARRYLSLPGAGPAWTAALSFGLVLLVFTTRTIAHPMGQLSANRQALLLPKRDSVEIRYYADFAEIPAQAEIKRMKREGRAYARSRITELLENIALTADGRRLPLEIESSQAVKTPGQGGLQTVTIIALLRARWSPTWTGPRTLSFTDNNFHGSPGWHEIRVQVKGGKLLRSIPADAPLPPQAVFKPLSYSGNPRSDTRLNLVVEIEGSAVSKEVAAALPLARSRKPDPLVRLLGTEALSLPMLLFALAVSAALGASHALSPGHGKTVVAAYLVGSRGTVGHAVVLGLVVTTTHVSSVLALGVITLYLSEFILPEHLYPWLGVFSGTAVAAIGATLMVSRLRSPSTQHSHSHTHAGHAHVAAAHGHSHGTETSEPVSLWQLLVLGVTGGIVPCPSALVVLLAAVALHRILLGLTLILSFSAGLAVVLITIGVLAVKAYAIFARFERFGSVSRSLGVLSAAAVTVLGIVIALKTGSALM